ncbi:Spx/MgsR family RNA polymerase-binding regulatory protein [Aureibacillus halotolerans]|uniref:Arsenate reductase/regulatory protein spx n=1 Tax=Aureibacillus halotolerans TaxID=1508390 RepID=A0A4R6U5D0_9BACI|nr:Spx/MgsR family RNA polymerase-binding regulatory protein [Aureibacillus halotolerans]TDQ41680.1 arsenate reductase/regulatory protein spx [Aureibacillus halotolerans]
MEENKAITFYTYPSCTSCRKTKAWLKKNDIDFGERHLFRETPSSSELKQILSLTTEGIDEILATRSQTFKQLKIDVNELTFTEMVELLTREPKLLRRPIITDGTKLVVGYNPSALRNISQKKQRLSIAN